MNERGFTFLEVLLASTLFAIVSVSSFSIFTLGISIWRRTQGVDVFERKALLAMEKMSRDIRLTIRSVDKGLDLKGNNRSFTLPAIVNVETEEGTMAQYGTFTYEWDVSSRTICKRTRNASDFFRSRTAKSDCLEVAGHIKKTQFRYWMYDGIGESYSWYDRWDAKDGLPAAVRMAVEIEPLNEAEPGLRQKNLERTVLLPVGGKGTEPKPGGEEETVEV